MDIGGIALPHIVEHGLELGPVHTLAADFFGEPFLDAVLFERFDLAGFVLFFGADSPSFDRGDVTIGRGRLFQCDNGLRQFAVVVMLVELPEHLFELACGAAGLNGAFHGEQPFS